MELSFSVGDALAPKCYEHDYNSAVAIEVLEHVEKDIEIFGNLRDGTFFIFSVPMFDSAAHVRHFKTPWSVYSRYCPYMSGLRVVAMKKIFVCYGTVDKTPTRGFNRLLKTRSKIELNTLPRILWRSVRKRLARCYILVD